LAASASSFGATYNDATGDLHDGTGGGDNFSGFTHLDIASVEVTNDASDITFTITLNGNIASAGGVDWGKYMVGIDSLDSDPGDSGPGGNPWGPRPIIMPDGMDYWIGSWADGGGGHQVWNYNDTTPGTWANPAGNEPVDLSNAAAGKISFTASLAELGLDMGDGFFFDVYSSGGGGGDGAIVRGYIVVPEPMTLGLVGLGVLALGIAAPRRSR
jgi:hypothetical protein